MAKATSIWIKQVQKEKCWFGSEVMFSTGYDIFLQQLGKEEKKNILIIQF